MSGDLMINEVDIKMSENGSWRSGGYFNTIWRDDWYTVIDKQHLGEKIGKQIITSYGKTLIDENAINGYEEEPIFEMIEEYTDNLRDEILGFVIEYLDEHMGD